MQSADPTLDCKRPSATSPGLNGRIDLENGILSIHRSGDGLQGCSAIER
jgi:hypothetical protein